MDKIIIYTQGDGWILNRIALEAKKSLEEDFEVVIRNTSSIEPCALAYYVNYELVHHWGINRNAKVTAGYFTHKQDRKLKLWKAAERLLDASVYMADSYMPKTKYGLKNYPYGASKDKRLVIGVNGKMYKDGRKGQDRLLELDSEIDNVEFSFMGSGWESLDLKNKAKYTEWKSEAQAIDWYTSLDMFISFAYIEGGSVPHLEAIKYGVPHKISFEVGNIEEWHQYYHIVEEVSEIVDYIDNLRKLYRGWSDFGDRHVNYFKKLIKNG